mmetsp:Transcript_6008/g.8266  ORF Transcript_6008/g.8266 Transcript_6008/m.8266 type:complete len:255 (+) Transcript_6008:628-1392(+)
MNSACSARASAVRAARGVSIIIPTLYRTSPSAPVSLATRLISSFRMLNSFSSVTSGTSMRGCGDFPALASSTAASKSARTCIALISGCTTPSLHPRKPSIGLCSFIASTRAFTFSTPCFRSRASSSISRAVWGRNSWSGGSSKRMMTGAPSMHSNICLKSPRCSGRSWARAASLSRWLSARIISRTMRMRSGAKNMCSVRVSPTPSAPSFRASAASFGVSALARMRRERNSSANSSRVPTLPLISGLITGSFPM